MSKLPCSPVTDHAPSLKEVDLMSAGLEVFPSLAVAARNGFRVYDRFEGGYIVTRTIGEGKVFAIVDGRERRTPSRAARPAPVSVQSPLSGRRIA